MIKVNLQRLGWGLLVPIVIASTLVVMLPAKSASASFNANNLIDDSVFNDTSSMTSGQIDDFLNQFSSSCISLNHGFSAPDPTGYSPANGYTYGGNVSAGNVILHAAQAYDLNPRVLLTTLQKEQNLVTGTSGCSVLRYAGATGYACPDGGTTYNYSGVNLYSINGNQVSSVSGTCVNSSAKVGFSQQLIRAAWLLKFGQQRSLGNYTWAIIRGSWDNSDDLQSCYSGPMTQGYRRICPSDSDTYYDGYTTIDGSSTHMDTGATAALYWYTPHFNGNQNFENIWQGWFGSPSAPAFAWQETGMKIMDEGQNAEIPTDNMHSGDRLYVTVTAQNVGTTTWNRDGGNPTRMGTRYPNDHMTPYCDTSWTFCNRTGVGMTEASVPPGGTAHFSFYMAVPNDRGQFWQYFKPVIEGQEWTQFDDSFSIYVNDNNSYDWQWNWYDAYTDATKTTPVNVDDLARNQQIYVVLHATNRSAQVWSNSGPNPTDLGTAMDQDRTSPACAPGWIACNRPARMDQAIVAPGQQATFSFYIKAPDTLTTWREHFKPVFENKGWTRNDANHIYLHATH